MARLKEDGDTLVVRTDMVSRDLLLGAHPRILYLSDHYVNYPGVMMRLGKATRGFVAAMIEDAWLLSAPRFLVRKWREERDAR